MSALDFFMSVFRVSLGVATVVLVAVFYFLILFFVRVFITQNYGYCEFIYWGG